MTYFDEIMKTILKAEDLGSRVLPNGTRLIGHVPHIAPEAYLHIVFPPLDEEGINQIEETIQRPLPHQLCTFYHHTNGLYLFSGSISLDGLRRSYVRIGDESWQPFSIDLPNVKERPLNADDSAVFFGGYGWDCSLLYMFSWSPTIYHCDRTDAEPRHEWPSFEDMLLSEVRRLETLFDDKGCSILDETVPTTPQ